MPEYVETGDPYLEDLGRRDPCPADVVDAPSKEG